MDEQKTLNEEAAKVEEQTAQPAPDAAPAAQAKTGGKNTGMAIASYFLFFLPYLTGDKSEFAMFHANQSFVLTVATIIGNILLPLIPVVGWLLWPFVALGIFVLWIMGIISASKGEMKPLPLIGGIRILNA